MVAFATPAELAGYVQSDVDTYTATQALDLASAAIRGVCGWHIYPSQSETVSLDTPSYSGDLFLPSKYVTAVTSVTEAGLLLAASRYVWTQNGRLARSYGAWGGYQSWLPGRVVVAFTHGYPTIPDAVKAVCLGWASVTYRNPDGLRSETVGSVSQMWAVAGPADQAVQDTDSRLLPYQLVGV